MAASSRGKLFLQTRRGREYVSVLTSPPKLKKTKCVTEELFMIRIFYWQNVIVCLWLLKLLQRKKKTQFYGVITHQIGYVCPFKALKYSVKFMERSWLQIETLGEFEHICSQVSWNMIITENMYFGIWERFGLKSSLCLGPVLSCLKEGLDCQLKTGNKWRSSVLKCDVALWLQSPDWCQRESRPSFCMWWAGNENMLAEPQTGSPRLMSSSLWSVKGCPSPGIFHWVEMWRLCRPFHVWSTISFSDFSPLICLKKQENAFYRKSEPNKQQQDPKTG